MPGSDLLEPVRQFLEDDGWHPRTLEARVLACEFEGDNARWSVYVLVPPEDHRVVIYSVTPDTTPAEARSAVLDYLNLCNFRLLVGNFELDPSDGETRFRTTIDAEGSEFGDGSMLRQALYANVLAMDQYLSGLGAVIDGSMTPAEAHEAALAE